MKLKNKRVLIIGAGASGKSAEAFLQQRGAKTYLYFDPSAIEFEESDFDLAVLSPGVSINHPLAQQFKSKLVSELTLGFSGRHKPIVAVTGTNGKTTVVNLIHQILGQNRSILCGNIGIPVTSVSEEIKRKIPIAEVSSFMLELPAPRVRIAVILNITQDHLDRHGTIENYVRHKESLAHGQKRCDRLILNFDCPTTRELAKGKRQRILWFSTTARVKGVYIEDGVVWLNLKRKRRRLYSLNELGLFRMHDIQNFLATLLVCWLLGKKNIGEVCGRPLKQIEDHRIEFVRAVGQTAFYNDSKATNIAATLAAVNSISLPVHLIMGGQRKGQDFNKFFENLPAHVARICVIGVDKKYIVKTAAAHGISDIYLCDGLVDALEWSVKGSGAKVVLLSPACASFDEFKNYQDRGNKFKEMVDKLGSV
ncbi:MAG: UDP-N-acetylmuramoyl-L-alanine--D-glutamate ligase [Firmicutes bacterium]|nr:UDP-N-acetylmuramoyl-L-alanine--D-glutamate ligase [Bacillota bacterium]